MKHNGYLPAHFLAGVTTSLHSLVVTGDSGGQVRFLDLDLKLLHWYEHTPKLGPLASVSFAYAPKLNMMQMQKER